MEGGHMVINDEVLPPGFRFHPTDEEIIIHYLLNKVIDINFASPAIGEVDLNTCEPWDLPKKAKMGENEWFFYFQKDRKYSRGKRTNRATKLGYWKATGKDREIHKKSSCLSRQLVGMKKTLVFYKGRAPKGERSNWVMHEYRLHGDDDFSHHYNISKTAKEEWVVCRVFHKKGRNETSDDPIPDVEIISQDHELGQEEFKANISLSELMSNPDQNNLLISGPYLDPISNLNPYCQIVHPDSVIPSDPVIKEADHIAAADSTLIFAPEEEDYINITDTYERMCKMGSFSSFNNSGLIRDDLLKPSDEEEGLPDLDYLWS